MPTGSAGGWEAQTSDTVGQDVGRNTDSWRAPHILPRGGAGRAGLRRPPEPGRRFLPRYARARLGFPKSYFFSLLPGNALNIAFGSGQRFTAVSPGPRWSDAPTAVLEF